MSRTYQVFEALFPGFELIGETETLKAAFDIAKRVSMREVQEVHEGYPVNRWHSVSVGTYVAHNEMQVIDPKKSDTA